MTEETKTSVFTNLRINLVDHDTLKATVSCKIADTMYLTGIKIIHGKQGRFVSMPSVKDAKGEYRDVFFPASKEIRDHLTATILEKYDEVKA